MEFTSPEAEQRYAALVRESADTIVGLDFDGTLSPIVADPTEAHIHPEAGEVLVALSAQVRAIAVITGRPARQALALGGLDVVGDTIGDLGRELFVYGQYGNERWSSTDRRVISPRPPAGVAAFLRDVHGVVRRAGLGEAYVEEKGLAVAVHTRRLDEPEEAYDRLLPLIADLAHHHDLVVEPGRNVIEVRAPGMDKGEAVLKLTGDLAARGFMFAGDDLGDIEAFRAVLKLRAQGMATLLVCSASAEQGALIDLADVVVDGPGGVLELLTQFTEDAASIRA
ncbi:trehalose-phosphatase [Nocardioides sp.]|uniref:trehalose-phosphatase n=1 Tax=Nocardioides sp. TaxID=35761 RepID=UPI003D108340